MAKNVRNLTKDQMAAIKLKERNGVKKPKVDPREALFLSKIGSGKKSKKIDITTNRDNPLDEFPKQDFKMWVVDMKTHKKVPGSDTIVRSQHFGQAVDDFLITWNKQKRMGMTIGYPVIQGEKAT